MYVRTNTGYGEAEYLRGKLLHFRGHALLSGTIPALTARSCFDTRADVAKTELQMRHSRPYGGGRSMSTCFVRPLFICLLPSTLYTSIISQSSFVVLVQVHVRERPAHFDDLRALEIASHHKTYPILEAVKTLNVL